jgi:hypothetical protein
VQPAGDGVCHRYGVKWSAEPSAASPGVALGPLFAERRGWSRKARLGPDGSQGQLTKPQSPGRGLPPIGFLTFRGKWNLDSESGFPPPFMN